MCLTAAECWVKVPVGRQVRAQVVPCFLLSQRSYVLVCSRSAFPALWSPSPEQVRSNMLDTEVQLTWPGRRSRKNLKTEVCVSGMDTHVVSLGQGEMVALCSGYSSSALRKNMKDTVHFKESALLGLKKS